MRLAFSHVGRESESAFLESLDRKFPKLKNGKEKSRNPLPATLIHNGKN